MIQLHKNWSAICGIQDNLMRMAIALVDLETEEGQQLAQTLSQYFTETESDGPIPLSAMLQLELKQLGRDLLGGEGQIHHFDENGVLTDFQIPHTRYKTTEGTYEFDILPEDISYDSLCFGKVINWRGKKLFVAEYYPERSFMEVVLCPAEMIYIDLPEYAPGSAN